MLPTFNWCKRRRWPRDAKRICLGFGFRVTGFEGLGLGSILETVFIDVKILILTRDCVSGQEKSRQQGTRAATPCCPRHPPLSV